MYRIISATGFTYTKVVALSNEEFWRRFPLWLKIDGQWKKIGG